MRFKVEDKVICTRKSFHLYNIPGVILDIRRCHHYVIAFRGRKGCKWCFSESCNSDNWNMKHIKLINK